MMPVFLCSIYLGVLALLGYAALSLVLGAVREHWALVAGLSFAAGCGIGAMYLFALSLLGFVPNRLTLLMLGVATVAALVALAMKGRLIRLSSPQKPGRFDWRSILAVASLLLIAFAVTLGAVNTLTPHLTEADAYSIWMFKAKILAGEALRPIPAALTDPALSYSHQDYPLGFPLLVAAMYGAAGRIDVTLGKSVLIAIDVSLICVIYGALRATLRRADALALTAAVTAAPLLTQFAAIPVAETYLIFQYACCLVMLLRWMEYQQRGDLLACAAFAAFAAFAKNEGLALLPLVGATALVFAVYRRSNPLSIDWIKGLLVAIAILLPWLIYRHFLPHTHEDYGGRLTHVSLLVQNLPKLGSIVPAFFAHMLHVNVAGAIWILLLIFACIGWRAFRCAPVVLLWLLLLAHLALYVATFMVTPWDRSMLIPMVGPRLLMHAMPTAILLMGLHLGEGRPSVSRATSPCMNAKARAGSP